MRRLLGLLLAIMVLAGLSLLYFPAPIDPVAWQPDPDPGLTGPFGPNDELAGVELLLEGVGVGPEDDTFWVAMPSLRKAVDKLADKPALRNLLSRLPLSSLNEGALGYSFVVGLGLEGEVLHNLQDTAAGYNNITSVNECDGSLYLGSLTMSAVARYPL